MKERELDPSPALDAAVYTFELLRNISSHLEQTYLHDTGIDFIYFEHAHNNSIAALKASNLSTPEESDVLQAISTTGLPEELIGSAAKILEFSELAEEKATSFLMNLTAFRNLKDKLSSEENARNIRNTITEQYFELYAAVTRKVLRTKDSSRLMKMFLSYGYLDEKLLDPEQTIALYKLAGINHADGIADVYFMQEWFEKIAEMEKEPSVDQFGHDYHDTFRELKKRGVLTEKDKQAYEQDKEGRLTFELNNMFKVNHRLCHGQIAMYFPVLHRDLAPHNLVRAHVTPSVIHEKLKRILEIDYAAFHREIHYRDAVSGIEKEIVMMQVVPDFILIPVYGTRAMMWQEISGRVRSSPGRILIPIFREIRG